MADMFRRRLRVLTIDELHCVENWKTFRPMYAELAVLRARLPNVPYLGCTATLGRDKVQAIRTGAGFNPSEPVVRTSVDRPEISIHLLLIEGNLKSFDDLRRFFPLNKEGAVLDAWCVPKTVFYFDSIRDILAFTQIVRKFWMPEFRYPSSAEQWIQPYFATMAEPDKQRVSREFEKADNPDQPDQGPIYRILVATEGYGMGADNPDIVNIIQYRIPEHFDSLVQRKGRAKRNGKLQGRFFFVVDRYASEMRLPKKPRRAATGPQMDYLVGNQSESGSDADTQVPSTGAAASKADAERRSKQQPQMMRFVNTKDCYRKAELGYYEDSTYKDGTVRPPMECCSLCNRDQHIPPFRPLPPVPKGDILFEAWMTKKLCDWRTRKVQALSYNSAVVPRIGTMVLPDIIVQKIAKHPRHIVDENSLRTYCPHWGEFDRYKDEIIEICRFAVENSGAGSELWAMDRARIEAIPMARRKVQPTSQPPPDPTEKDLAIKARRERRNAFLIRNGHALDAEKPEKRGRKTTKKTASSQGSNSQDCSPALSEAEPSQVGSSQAGYSQENFEDMDLQPIETEQVESRHPSIGFIGQSVAPTALSEQGSSSGLQFQIAEDYIANQERSRSSAGVERVPLAAIDKNILGSQEGSRGKGTSPRLNGWYGRGKP